MNETNQNSKKVNQNQPPSITLPKGGGAIKEIDEKFSVNAVNGTAAFSLPLPVSPARNDFSPALELSYNSGAGNSPFGLGWDVAVPSISRKTDKGLPQYDDAADTDTFILSGAEDLVPLLKENGKPDEYPKQENDQNYQVKKYRPRIEGLFARIERWENLQDGTIHWRSISRDNVTSIYGNSQDSRIADPNEPRKIFRWLLEFSYDDKGNCIKYHSKKENIDGVSPELLYEKNRLSGLAKFTNQYLKKVQYGNKSPYKQGQSTLPEFMFETVFDYGEHDSSQPLPDDKGQWDYRSDAFSDYRAGFEIRTARLCKRVLLFHNFDELGDVPCLVNSFNFKYEPQPGFTFLKAITQTGYIKQADNTYTSKSLPPSSFDYQSHEWNTEIKTISEKNLTHAPIGIDEPQYQWIDLYSEGVAGILTESNNALYYKSNLGNGEFTPAQLISPKPSMTGLNRGALQIQDLEANGQKYLVNHDTIPKGYFELSETEDWQPFETFKQMPSINFGNPNARFIDLTGDGKPDIMVSEDEVFCWYPAKGKAGYGASQRVRKVFDEEQGPAIVFADSTQTIFLADMSGDGLTDIARIRNGEIVYWPNLGYGHFGAKISMGHAPLLDHPDAFNPRHIKLADIDGSGTTDLIYLGQDKFRVWLNLSGNTWSKTPQTIAPFPKIDNFSNISVIDLLGNGTSCIVWSSLLPQHAEKPLQYIDLMAGKKPCIMNGYQDNMGQEVHLHYKPSTHFYLDDKKAGTPWVTKLPFPMHCVSKVESIDRVSNTQYCNEYCYHHGYYGYTEREFRGFGRVDQLDTKTFEHFVKRDAANVVAEPLHQPPVLTKTWYHTGAFLNKDQILNQFAHEYYQNTALSEYRLPEPQLPDDQLTTNEWREALRA